MGQEINRIKIVLVEKHKTGKWLADALDCDIKDLLRSNK